MRAVDLRNNLAIPAGPEASSLGQYGEVGISRYTGALDFSIDLASLGDKSLNWGFSLRYDGGGVKPDNLPSHVGQNWSLAGVGVITRSVQGFPDLDTNYYDAAHHWETNPTTMVGPTTPISRISPPVGQLRFRVRAAASGSTSSACTLSKPR